LTAHKRIRTGVLAEVAPIRIAGRGTGVTPAIFCLYLGAKTPAGRWRLK